MKFSLGSVAVGVAAGTLASKYLPSINFSLSLNQGTSMHVNRLHHAIVRALIANHFTDIGYESHGFEVTLESVFDIYEKSNYFTNQQAVAKLEEGPLTEVVTMLTLGLPTLIWDPETGGNYYMTCRDREMIVAQPMQLGKFFRVFSTSAEITALFESEDSVTSDMKKLIEVFNLEELTKHPIVDLDPETHEPVVIEYIETGLDRLVKSGVLKAAQPKPKGSSKSTEKDNGAKGKGARANHQPPEEKKDYKPSRSVQVLMRHMERAAEKK